MRCFARRFSFVVAIVAMWSLIVGVAASPAHADPKTKKEIEQKVTEAMENYDLLEYEEARKLLNAAVALGAKDKLDADPVMAKVYLRLGIVHFSGLRDAEAAKLAFVKAVEINRDIQLDKAYSTPEMAKLLAEAKAEVGGAKGADEPEPAFADGPEVDCRAVRGLEHTIIDSAPAGKSLRITVAVAGDIKPAKLAIMYRRRGAVDFTEAKMSSNGCVYAGEIPANELSGDLLHYYVAAYNAKGKVIASKGSVGSPNIVELIGGGAAGGGSDEEDPLGGGGGRADAGTSSDSRDVEGTVTVSRGRPTMFITIAGGSGGGYVTGETEQEMNEVKCCFAPQLVHLAPEIGYFLNSTTSLSIAGRIGFPIGANRMGHATAAPAALLKMRKTLSSSGSGLQISGAIGGGIIRDTIKLDGQPADMDTDIVALGPLLIGAGAGYHAQLGAGLAIIAEMGALAGVPVVKDLGSSHLNFGVQFDLNLGIQVGF